MSAIDETCTSCLATALQPCEENGAPMIGGFHRSRVIAAGKTTREANKKAKRRSRDNTWLDQIEALQPGDRCEFHYPARTEWIPGVVVKNGGSGWWEVRDESDTEGRRGKIASSIYIEHVRLPGQTEAWPRL